MAATNKQLAIIRRAYDSVPDFQEGFTHLTNVMLDTALVGEKRHRNGRPAVRNFPALYAARYFVVKWLLDAATTTTPPRLSDYLSLRTECFMAAAIADSERHGPLLREWAGKAEWRGEFNALDYVTMMD